VTGERAPIFDDLERTNATPSDHREPTFDFLNRVAGEYWVPRVIGWGRTRDARMRLPRLGRRPAAGAAGEATPLRHHMQSSQVPRLACQDKMSWLMVMAVVCAQPLASLTTSSRVASGSAYAGRSGKVRLKSYTTSPSFSPVPTM
jgi:hypothetical protein